MSDRLAAAIYLVGSFFGIIIASIFGFWPAMIVVLMFLIPTVVYVSLQGLRTNPRSLEDKRPFPKG